MTQRDLSSRRLSYDADQLSDDAPADPFTIFDTWMQEAVAAQDAGADFEATAMTVATARRVRGGMWQPSARVALLKSYDEHGFVFFTNYESAKGEQLACNPHASLSFYWHHMQRQVNIEGLTERVDPETSEQYFFSRPEGSQLGAWASQQSRPVASREELEAAYQEVAEKYADGIPYPSHWGGYCVVPHRIEFWQGRPSRMHDRLVYQRADKGWKRTRLAP